MNAESYTKTRPFPWGFVVKETKMTKGANPFLTGQMSRVKIILFKNAFCD